MRNKLFVIFFILLLSGSLFSEEPEFVGSVDSLFEKVTEATSADYVDPELPTIDEIKSSNAFSLKKYEAVELEEISRSVSVFFGNFENTETRE